MYVPVKMSSLFYKMMDGESEEKWLFWDTLVGKRKQIRLDV